MITPIIIAGGTGTRLWPMSRTAFPKQFLAFGNQLTMLQQTMARLDGLHSGKPVVITNEEHRFLVAEQMRQQSLKADFLLEPVCRNTAPAIALAAFQLLKKNPNDVPVMLVLASDHIIQNTEAFQQSVLTLLPDVEAGKFGTLGIVPTEPATGYGYIEVGGKLSAGIAAVNCFVEKPDKATAQRYMDEETALSSEQGSHKWLWNSGMFMIRADRYLEELKQYRPDIHQACEKAMANTSQDLDFTRISKDAFEACPDESIDYAVMEPLSATGNVVVTPLDAGWSDVGSWSALWDIGEKCTDGNVLLGEGVHQNTILKDTRDSFIFSENRLVTTLGVDNLVVVDTPDAILIAKKDKVQNVKDIVAEIKQQGRNEHYNHREVYRPWGYYDVVTLGECYKVKKICVNPGASLSLQRHHHRSEHWVVVSGQARVTRGDDVYLVHQNESTYISPRQVHKLENPGFEPLVIIEVQTGSYLQEDDIERLEDRYGRE